MGIEWVVYQRGSEKAVAPRSPGTTSKAWCIVASGQIVVTEGGIA